MILSEANNSLDSRSILAKIHSEYPHFIVQNGGHGYSDDIATEESNTISHMQKAIALFPEIIREFENRSENFYISASAGNDEHFWIIITTNIWFAISLDLVTGKVYEDPFKILEIVNLRTLKNLTKETGDRANDLMNEK